MHILWIAFGTISKKRGWQPLLLFLNDKWKVRFARFNHRSASTSLSFSLHLTQYLPLTLFCNLVKTQVLLKIIEKVNLIVHDSTQLELVASNSKSSGILNRAFDFLKPSVHFQYTKCRPPPAYLLLKRFDKMFTKKPANQAQGNVM